MPGDQVKPEFVVKTGSLRKVGQIVADGVRKCSCCNQINKNVKKLRLKFSEHEESKKVEPSKRTVFATIQATYQA